MLKLLFDLFDLFFHLGYLIQQLDVLLNKSPLVLGRLIYASSRFH